MVIRRWLCAVVAALVLAVGAPTTAPQTPAGLPERLSNGEYWRLIGELSEPDGYFSSDNLVSNEDTFQIILPELVKVVKPGGVYVGVGPDQNFTYIAAFKPAMVFIPDIRRGNLRMHLLYKALMEASDGLTFNIATGPVTMRNRHPDKPMYLAQCEGATFKVIKSYDDVKSGETCKQA